MTPTPAADEPEYLKVEEVAARLKLKDKTIRAAAEAAGLLHAPYDLRGSFASLLIQEGRNVVDVAKQLGHTPETCLRYYARLFDEAPERPVVERRAGW